MISPLLRTTRMPAKQTKALLIFFIVRNTLGLLAFVWMVSLGRDAGGIWVYLFPALTLAYLGTAIYNGNKLYQQYRRTLAKEQREAARNATH